MTGALYVPVVKDGYETRVLPPTSKLRYAEQIAEQDASGYDCDVEWCRGDEAKGDSWIAERGAGHSRYANGGDPELSYEIWETRQVRL